MRNEKQVGAGKDKAAYGKALCSVASQTVSAP